MRNFFVAFAIFAPPASADYMKIESISASTTCDGTPTSITSNMIGCETDGDTRCRIYNVLVHFFFGRHSQNESMYSLFGLSNRQWILK